MDPDRGHSLLTVAMGVVGYTVRPSGTWRSGWPDTLLVAAAIVLLAWQDSWLWLIALVYVPAGLVALSVTRRWRHQRGASKARPRREN